MTGRPTVQVLLDDGTGTFPHDVTTYVLQSYGHSFNRGRENEQTASRTGTLNLVFDNTDGRFTRGSTTIDSPSPIVVDQRIRLKETVNGTAYTRFTGYVKKWPVAWPGGGGGAYSVARITATCAQARAERRPLRSVIQEELALDDLAAHYVLGEPVDSTAAADSSGNQAPALTMAGTGTDVVFGSATGPATDGLTAAEFAGERYLAATYSTTPSAVECWFATTTNDATTRTLVGMANFSGPAIVNGNLTYSGAGSAGSVADGNVHHVLWQGSDIYLDGALTGLAASAPTGTRLSVGESFIGSIAHVATHSSTLTAGRVADHAEAGSTGFAGESGTDRITRLAGYAGIPLGTLDTSLTNVPFKDHTGTSAWSAIQDVTAAEGGLSVVDGSGNLIFLNRNAAPEKTTPDVTITASFVPPDVEPVDDDAEIINYFEATAEGTGIAQVVRDTDSDDAHGRYSDSKTYLVQTDAEALDRANWIVGTQAEPSTRYGSLPIDLLNMSAAQQEAAIAGLEPGAWLRVTGMNSQTPDSTTVDVMVQGFTEKLTANEWSLTLNVVARARFEAAIYDDATFGVYGESRYYY